MGMTETIIWDEIILKDIFDEHHPMIDRIKKLYGTNSYDSEKYIDGKVFELNIVLINEWSFGIICKNVEFRDC